jgi:hypothetical protein
MLTFGDKAEMSRRLLLKRFKASFIFNVDNYETLRAEDIRIHDVRLLEGNSNTLSRVKRFQAFFKHIARSSITSLVVEGIKRMLSA